MVSVCFQGKPFNTTVIQVYAPTSNAEEAEVEQFYEDLVAQTVKHLPTMQETRVRSLGQEDPLQKGMATHHGQRSLVGYSPWGCKQLDMTERLHFHFYEDLQDLLEV